MYNAELLLKVVALVVFFHALVLCGAEKTAPASISDPLLERARNGEAQAQLEAGFAFYRNNNPVRAAYWFQAAAKQGIAEAQYNAGRCYLAGYGVEKNLHQALDFFKLASEHDLPPAQLETAKLLLNGIAAVPEATPPRKVIEPDEKTAVALLEKAAAKRYFNKELSELTTGEAALLVGLIPSPGNYNPFVNPGRARERRNLVLQVMHDQGYISDEDLAKAKAEPLPEKEPTAQGDKPGYTNTVSHPTDFNAMMNSAGR